MNEEQSKTCACCMTETADATCPSCGEASWLSAPEAPESEPATEPKKSRRAQARAAMKAAEADQPQDDAAPEATADEQKD